VVEEFDFEAMLKASEGQAAKAEEFARRAAELVGRAESPDARIRVEWDDDKGVAGLEIDPRALRMPAGDLAEVILATAQAAKRDLRSQADELTRELFGPDGDPMSLLQDPAEVQAKIEEVRSVFDGSLRDATALMEDLRKSFGR
jgi:DNA-binding protein YbaB